MARQLESVAAMTCMTVVLMLFNVVFCCIGFLLVGIAVFMKIQLQDYKDLGLEFCTATFIGVSFLGLLISIVGILACCCTTKQYPSLLYLYGVFLVMIALIEIFGGALIYTNYQTFVDSFDRGLNESLHGYGTKDETKTLHFDVIQKLLKCCGSRGYTDWLNMTPSKSVPSSCCSVELGECDTTNTDDIYTEGCYNRVMYTVKGNLGIVAAIALCFVSFPMVGLVLACCLASYINKVNYELIA